LQALGEGVIKILSDQGLIMEWTVRYKPLSSGTVLSPVNYHSTHKSKYYAFYHLGTSVSTGKTGCLDYNQREVESIQMKRTHNGEWMTTNQVLVSSPIENTHIIRSKSKFRLDLEPTDGAKRQYASRGRQNGNRSTGE
jgi:hypothetical protein